MKTGAAGFYKALRSLKTGRAGAVPRIREPMRKIFSVFRVGSAFGLSGRRPPNAECRGILAEQVEVLEDAVDDGGIIDEGDDAHHARAGGMGAAQRVNLVNLFDEPRPVRLARVAPRVFGFGGKRVGTGRGVLPRTLRESQGRLFPKAPAAVGVAAVVDGGFLMMVGDMRRELGDEGEGVENAGVALVLGDVFTSPADDAGARLRAGSRDGG